MAWGVLGLFFSCRLSFSRLCEDLRKGCPSPPLGNMLSPRKGFPFSPVSSSVFQVSVVLIRPFLLSKLFFFSLYLPPIIHKPATLVCTGYPLCFSHFPFSASQRFWPCTVCSFRFYCCCFFTHAVFPPPLVGAFFSPPLFIGSISPRYRDTFLQPFLFPLRAFAFSRPSRLPALMSPVFPGFYKTKWSCHRYRPDLTPVFEVFSRNWALSSTS